jgi:hypothetical protein
MMPPARCTSSMWYFCVAGATLHRFGTLRLSVDVGHGEVDLALVAAASRCSTVLVEPPMAMSSAHGVLERLEGGDVARQHAVVVLLVVALGQIHDQPPGLQETALAVGVGGQQSSRCPAATGPAPRSGSSSSWR